MRSSEIYFLNSALDDAEIPFIPTPPAHEMSMLMIDAVKNSLIQKGLLKNEAEFTNEGVRQTRLLQNYKSAIKHIQINNLSIGILSEIEAVIVAYNPVLKDYSIKLVDCTNIVDQIIESIPFLSIEDNRKEEDLHDTSTLEVQEKYMLNPWNHLRITVWQESAIDDELFFWHEGRYYRYDCTAGSLHKESKQFIVDCLSERTALA